MKKFSAFIAVLAVFSISACNSPSGTSTEKSSDSTVLPPPSSNSDATNSSVADTAYPKKDSMTAKPDSLRK